MQCVEAITDRLYLDTSLIRDTVLMGCSTT